MSNLMLKRLMQNCFWDEEEQQLWVDCRKVLPEHGVMAIPSWDRMMLSSDPIPDYPKDFALLSPSAHPQLSYWQKQIPAWVRESCALFPTHQLKLLHYVGRYPQLLELLDHSPVLAWRLMTSHLSEEDVVSMLNDKRTQLVEQLGWPGKVETFRFLKKLRLRQVNQQIAEQVDVCLLDEKRLNALQALPRVNSMALSLAARFPEMIGCRLHLALASMPCRPMQCQSMIALLEDVYRLAEHLALPISEINKIANTRYLVEVEKLYNDWLQSATNGDASEQELALTDVPRKLTTYEEGLALSALQGHAWFADWQSADKSMNGLYAMQVNEEVVAFLFDETRQEVLRVRQMQNQLPTSEQLSRIHLWSTQIANDMNKSAS
ncbi:hypothetical protein EI16_05230 [Hydrogenovibrio marinus]|uniref:Uncharacterized protein n=2 Tax=Hydrogenovibrio marinus TaxID=28885 RepID=A0A066ZZE5_HYDMR|nr:hypothetical protein EI16_05230 [Hydrogenovibrio marinus]